MGLIPIDGRGGLAAAQRVEELPGRAAADEDHERADEGEHHHAEEEEGAVALERTPGVATWSGMRPAARPSPSGTRTLSNISANARVASAR